MNGQFGTFDYGNVLANVEAIKGARIRNRIGQMQADELQRQEENRQKRQQINAMIEDMPGRIEEYRRQGLDREADDLAMQYVNTKKVNYDYVRSARDFIDKDNWSDVRTRFIREGAIEPNEMPTRYDETWLKAQERKARSDFKVVTEKYGTPKGTRARDIRVVDGVPQQPGQPYDPNKPKSGAGGGRLKSGDSNAIANATASLFGGIYDPQTGQITGLSKDEQQRVLSVAEEAERIFAENPALGHRQAAAQAARNAGIDIQSLQGATQDPLGLLGGQ